MADSIMLSVGDVVTTQFTAPDLEGPGSVTIRITEIQTEPIVVVTGEQQ